MIIYLWLLNLIGVTGANAEEERCTELGTNCICSEPLNSTITRQPNSWYNPDDSTTKQCNIEGSGYPGYAVTRNSGDLWMSSESALLNALPSGHGVQKALRAPEGYTGMWFIGHSHGYYSTDVGPFFRKRVAMRFYRYYSSNYEMNNYYPNLPQNPLCEQRGKLIENDIISVTSHGGGFTAYNFYNFTPGKDCCFDTQVNWPRLEDLRGKWWRFEAVWTNIAGPGWNLVLYIKNVTANTPEQKVLDVSQWPFWSSAFTPPKTGPLLLKASGYTQGTCAGFTAFSHFMLAGWDTDEGQRIGSAREVEGGSNSTFSSPTNLKIIP